MKAIDYVVHAMNREGVEYLFGYPMHALIEAAAIGGIRPIIARTEKTLVNIAEGYAMSSGGARPAVVCVQGGPGIENAFGGVAQAYADGTPMLVLPGGGEVRAHGLGGEFDPLPAFSHVTKWAPGAGPIGTATRRDGDGPFVGTPTRATGPRAQCRRPCRR
mgnify:CR=1 FL=1